MIKTWLHSKHNKLQHHDHHTPVPAHTHNAALYWDGNLGRWCFKKKKRVRPHIRFLTLRLLLEVCVCVYVCVTKMPTQKHISLVCEMEIKFRADVPITCLALPASLGFFSFLTEAVRFSIF